MAPIRIFISFDGEHDADLRDRLHAESERGGSHVEFSGHSQGGAITDAWIASCRTRIRAADEVIVICGEHTDTCERVATELRIAQEEKRPYFLVWGRRERPCTKPATAKAADGMYSWTWEILQSQILTIQRAVRTNERLAELGRSRAARRSDPHGPH
jgi:hypothetical protein